jgi:fused signal recognition particle receptor
VTHPSTAIECKPLVPRNVEQDPLIQASVQYLQKGQNHVFEAPTGWGKTVAGCYVAAALGQPTLIVVTKSDLMKELDKMRRTAEKLIPGAPHQTLLVMDATTGQNGLQQARLFTEAARVTGIVLTKLDGTAKGGIVLAIATELGLPVVYAGTGEKIDDIIPFDSKSFIDSLID